MLAQRIAIEPTAVYGQQEKAKDVGDTSEDRNIDQETRHGNLSSGVDFSAQQLKFSDADRNGQISGDQQTPAKAHQYLNNQWDSETTNSHQFNMTSGFAQNHKSQMNREQSEIVNRLGNR